MKQSIMAVLVSVFFIAGATWPAHADQPMWTADRVESELTRFEPVLKQLGLKAPMERARQLVAMEKNWSNSDVQQRWRSRVDYWRTVLLGEGDGALDRILNLDHPGLAQYKPALGSENADQEWASYMRQRSLLHDELRHSRPLQQLLQGKFSWPIYHRDGSFRMQAAEELLNGAIRMWSLQPVQTSPDEDYDYLVQHPEDRLFQVSHQCCHQLGTLTLAYLEAPADRWAGEWIRQVLSHLDQCPALPYQYNDFSTGVNTGGRPANVAWTHYSYVGARLMRLLTGYVAMKNSPALSDRFHGILLRMIHFHARYLHELGATAYGGNVFSGTAKRLYSTTAFFPELRHGEQWVQAMWPQFRSGIERELLKDGCHHHRSFGYHMVFVGRALAMIAIGSRLPKSGIPADVREKTEQAVDAFVKVSTPIRSTPGINDDVIGFDSLRWLLTEAARAFSRDDWLYLATDGEEGDRPAGRAFLLPRAQVIAMRSGWSRTGLYGFFNVSPDSGHHHPDTLSLQIWAGDRPLLVDPGVGHYYTGERDISKRSWWHNCPTFGAHNLPSGVKPTILSWQTTDDTDYAVGRIEVNGVVIHRHVFFVSRRYFVLWDEFESLPEDRPIWENFNFGVAPDLLRVSDDAQSAWTQSKNGSNLLLRVAQKKWTIRREKGAQWRKYGARPIDTAIVHFLASGQTAGAGFAALLIPFQGLQPPNVTFSSIDTRSDGTTELTVSINGETSKLATRTVGP